jgi:hypothetical protein
MKPIIILGTDSKIRILLQGDRTRFITIAKILYSVGQKEKLPENLKLFDEDKQALIKLALELDRQSKEDSKDYSGKIYYIWGRDRRMLGKKRPDVYLGHNVGVNFIEACQDFFTFVCKTKRGVYNPKRNTLAGYDLIEGKCETEL